MRIIHLNTFDGRGGAARAAYRLHVGLCRLGHDSSMLVAERQGGDPRVRALEVPPPSRPRSRPRRLVDALAAWLSQFPIKLRPAPPVPPGYEMFSDDRSPYSANVAAQLPPCDVVHLHWVAHFLDYGRFLPALSPAARVVWTLHDMNPFTGGCHYDDGCGRFASGCGSCPQLGSGREDDRSRAVWTRKKRVFDALAPGRLDVVSPSRWLAGEAAQKPALRSVPISVIPYGLDTSTFAPRDRSLARGGLGLRDADRVVLFVSEGVSNRRKGFALLLDALAGLAAVPDCLLLSLGHSVPVVRSAVPHRHLGLLNDDRLLSLVYSAADVVVVPSLQDNLPNIVLESFACGTPVVGFNVGGIPDMIRPGVTGALVPPGDVRTLREAIVRVLGDEAARATMAANCRRLASEEYDLAVQARRYLDLYRSPTGQAEPSGRTVAARDRCEK